MLLFSFVLPDKKRKRALSIRSRELRFPELAAAADGELVIFKKGEEMLQAGGASDRPMKDLSPRFLLILPSKAAAGKFFLFQTEDILKPLIRGRGKGGETGGAGADDDEISEKSFFFRRPLRHGFLHASSSV